MMDNARRRQKRRCCDNYRRVSLNSRSVVILIAWNVLIMLTANILQTWAPSTAWSTREKEEDTFYSHELARQTAASLLVLAYPLFGWLADAWMGRFRIMFTGLCLLFAAVFFVGAATVSYNYGLQNTPVVFAYLAMAAQIVGYACYFANYIQFTTDHLVGASGEQLSFTIYWLLWADFFSQLVKKLVVDCQHLQPLTSVLICFCLSVPFLGAAFLWIGTWKSTLFTRPLITNPVKDIGKVLCYARRHKYPERRSALTYWEDEYPSRLDLGKDKYGGPFTEDEVESVKTTLRLIPLIMCMTLYVLNDRGAPVGDLLRRAPGQTVQCVVNQVVFADLLPVVLLPLYHFLIYPFCYNYVSTMLKRFGVGLGLMVAAFASSFVLVAVGNVQDKEAVCSSNAGDTSEAVLPLSYWWSIVPIALSSVGFMLTHFSTFEFVMAQSPHQMKGLTVGLIFSFRGFWKGAANGIAFLFPLIKSTFPNCDFYNYLTFMLIMVAAFFLFLVLSKWYTLRVRDTIVPYYLFAENYTEKVIQQAKEYRQAQDYGCYGDPLVEMPL